MVRVGASAEVAVWGGQSGLGWPDAGGRGAGADRAVGAGMEWCGRAGQGRVCFGTSGGLRFGLGGREWSEVGRKVGSGTMWIVGTGPGRVVGGGPDGRGESGRDGIGWVSQWRGATGCGVGNEMMWCGMSGTRLGSSGTVGQCWAGEVRYVSGGLVRLGESVEGWCGGASRVGYGEVADCRGRAGESRSVGVGKNRYG